MKLCRLCGKEKPLDSFYRNRGNLCKKCEIENGARWGIKQRNEFKIKAVTFLGGKCVRCGYSKCMGALEFHHLFNKKANISTMITNKRSWKEIEDELKKCIVLCSNCHREEDDRVRKERYPQLL